MFRACALGLILTLVSAVHGPVVLASGPCKSPPFDPMMEVATAEMALSMDAWGKKALRRDKRGKTCADIQEVVDILLVRWLQAHPEIHVKLNGTETEWLLSKDGAFLLRIKSEAWAACRARRRWFRPSWGRRPSCSRAEAKRRDFVRDTGGCWGS